MTIFYRQKKVYPVRDVDNGVVFIVPAPHSFSTSFGNTLFRISNGMYNGSMSIKSMVIALATLLVLTAGGYLYWKNTPEIPYEFIIAGHGNLIQEVSVVGKVEPAEKVDLAFEKTGKVARVYATVGDTIRAGAALITLENAELLAELAEAEADVKMQQAKLEELRKGTRDEEIRVQEVKVENARVAVRDAQKNLVDKINDAYTKSGDAIRSKVDQFFISPRGSDPELDFSVFDSGLERALENGRLQIEQTFTLWRTSLDALIVSDNIAEYSRQAAVNLNQTRTLLDDAALALSTVTASVTLSQTKIDGYRSDVSTARANINTAIINLSAAEEKLRGAESGLKLTEEELLLKKAGPIKEQITAQVAKVAQSEAAVLTKRAELAKTILVSPINGVVVHQDAKVGEIVAAHTVLVSIISASRFEIKINVPEADIAKLERGDRARVTLDAYGNDVVFEAVLTQIEPAETILEGVTTYAATLQFSQNDSKIRSGMTANMDISTDERVNVIAIPRRAVVTKNGTKFVRIMRNNTIKEIPITTGLQGSDGRVEIIQGITEGDRVVVFFE